MSDLIERAEAARQFPTNTCGASRHAEQIGVALVLGEPYPMLTEEPNYCGESILATVAALWEARTEIERLTAALHAQPGPVSMDDVEWAGKVHLAEAIRERDKAQRKYERQREATVNTYARVRRLIEALRVTGQHSNRWKLKYKSQVPSLKRTIRDLCAERDELRRQLDPMGEYTSADELIAALRAEKAEDEAMKLDAQRYRWLRPRFFAADFAYSDPPVCAIVFRWPESAKISANLDREIDAAMGASNE